MVVGKTLLPPSNKVMQGKVSNYLKKHISSAYGVSVIGGDDVNIHDEYNLHQDDTFYQCLNAKDFKQLAQYWKANDGRGFFDKQGNIDLVATIFYKMNCLWEYEQPHSQYDNFGRFKYSSLINPRKILDNEVESLFNTLLGQLNVSPKSSKSRVFISHDIDTIYGSLLQDSFHLFKHKRFLNLLGHLSKELLKSPSWKNLDLIQRLNSEYDVESTFFFLTQKGKGKDGIMNADYNLGKEANMMERLQNKGGVLGLHKASTSKSFNEEKQGHNLQPFNRYHFLKFQLPQAWDEMEEGGILFDSSLGFAEHYGFRNNYGRPFKPFNFNTGKEYSFVECPLHLMDGTFHKYMQMPQDKIGKTIIDFIEKNKNDCVLSLLWHNTYFTDYKYGGFLKEYKKILSYLVEEGITSITPQEIIAEYA